MKKNYIQPIVGAEEFLISNQALCTSPNGITVTPVPIPEDGGGD